MNPIILGSLFINFSGVLVPYSQIVVFWKYWMYYLNPFTYLIGSLLTQILYDVKVKCNKKELSSFAPPSGQTCGEYMSSFFETGYGYIVDNSSTTLCQYCEYKDGAQYAQTLNLTKRMDGWRDVSYYLLLDQKNVLLTWSLDWYHGSLLCYDLWVRLYHDEVTK